MTAKLPTPRGIEIYIIVASLIIQSTSTILDIAVSYPSHAATRIGWTAIVAHVRLFLWMWQGKWSPNLPLHWGQKAFFGEKQAQISLAGQTSDHMGN